MSLFVFFGFWATEDPDTARANSDLASGDWDLDCRGCNGDSLVRGLNCGRGKVDGRAAGAGAGAGAGVGAEVSEQSLSSASTSLSFDSVSPDSSPESEEVGDQREGPLQNCRPEGR